MRDVDSCGASPPRVICFPPLSESYAKYANSPLWMEAYTLGGVRKLCAYPKRHDTVKHNIPENNHNYAHFASVERITYCKIKLNTNSS